MEFATLESRLVTFEPPSKRSKLGWPHKTPTPEELAKAGFYYKPSGESNDNTVCYLCERQLDGWEQDDDPLDEHLKHSPECGWALLVNAGRDGSLDTSTMEDPTGQQLTEARRSTFSIGWPHETKRGWTCKIEKMVEAGWHLAPVPGSEDFVSCIHCKLSLDGWEPKDNPFDEHYRRSPGCPFFHFAGTTAPSKRPKTKKGRASRASRTSKASTRLSTQSNSTMLTDGPSVIDIPDLDESIDTSTVSVMSTMSTASTATTKGKRKGGRAKATKSKRTKTIRSTRAKKEEVESEVVQETNIQEEVEPERTPTQTTNISEEVAVAPSQDQSLPSPAPSPKRDIMYPSIVNSPGVSNETHRLSPVGAPPQPSPTPVKTRLRSSAGRVSTPPQPSTIAQAPHSPANDTPSPPSDIENAPPSTHPASARPTHAASSPMAEIPQWTPADIELIFTPNTPQHDASINLGLTGAVLSADEQQMTVQEWIEHIAGRAEDALRTEAERVVGIFEREGQRAMGVLEGIVCV